MGQNKLEKFFKTSSHKTLQRTEVTGPIRWTSTFKSWRHRGHLLHHTFMGDPYAWSPFDYIKNDGFGQRVADEFAGAQGREVTTWPGNQSHLYSAIECRATTSWEKKSGADRNHDKGVRRKNTSENKWLKKWHVLTPVLVQPGSCLSFLSLTLPWVVSSGCSLTGIFPWSRAECDSLISGCSSSLMEEEGQSIYLMSLWVAVRFCQFWQGVRTSKLLNAS